MAMACVERFMPRPELVTYGAIAGLDLLLHQGRHRTARGQALIALLQVVWSNCHGLFVIGPFMVGCHLLNAVVRRARGAANDLVPLVQTFGVYAWVLLTESVGSGPAVVAGVGELSPTFGQAARSDQAFWFFLTLLAATVAGAIGLLRARSIPARLLVLVGMTAAALTARRNVVLVALIAGPFVVQALATLRPRWLRLPRAAAIVAICVIAAWSWYPLSGRFYLDIQIPSRIGFGVTPSFFPHRLPEFLDRVGFDGQVLNSNTLGGFYLYHRFPGQVPLTDGRWEVYDPEALDKLLTATRTGVGWRDHVARYEVDGILLAHTSSEAAAMLGQLESDPAWRLVYLDAAASFWMPAGAPGAPPEINLALPVNIPSTARPDDALILSVFLEKVGAHEAAIVNLERVLAFGVHRRATLERLGMEQIRAGHMAEARITFEDLLELDPDSEIALNELAFLAFSAGDPAKAAKLMERVLEIAPDNAEYRQNYERVLDAMGDRVQRGNPER
jgi:tetratricopeptide (TPR) repeat protein